jgi:ABC-2 type transport system ATP-binding protein
MASSENGVMEREVVVFDHVSKRLGNRLILSDISFSIHEAEIFGLIGPSGAGKTTLLRTLIGFYKPESGKVFYEGKEVRSLRDLTWEVGFATQDECFYEDLTCEENMRYFGTLYRIPSQELEESITQLLALVELSAARKVIGKRLSGGMRRRLDVAIALLHRPKVLILDEPTAGLDPVLRKHMLALIERIRKNNIAVIITSHLLEELEQICDNVAIMFNGKFIVQGSPTDIKNKHFPYSEIHLVTYPGKYDRILYAATAAGAPILAVMLEEHMMKISTPQVERTVYDLLRVLPSLGEHLIDIDVVKPTLSEVFEKYIEHPEEKRAP